MSVYMCRVIHSCGLYQIDKLHVCKKNFLKERHLKIFTSTFKKANKTLNYATRHLKLYSCGQFTSLKKEASLRQKKTNHYSKNFCQILPSYILMKIVVYALLKI